MKRLVLTRASRGGQKEVALRARRVMRGATALMLCAMLASTIEGCTAIGFAVGAASDARAGRGGPELLTAVKAGRPVTLLLRDGRKLQGRFAGWARDSVVAAPTADSLHPRWESVRLATGSGEVTIHTREIEKVYLSVSRGKVTGLLAGAAVDAVLVAGFVWFIEGAVASSWGE